MENSTRPINLLEISYPVFRLGFDKPSEDGGVLYYAQTDEEGNNRFRIVDDKNIQEPTLARRRLKLSAEGISLYRLNKAVFFLGDFIKISKKNLWFIDSNGRLFTHEKKIRAKLKFHKISKLIPIQGGGCIIEVESIAGRFKSLFAPERGEQYAGILEYNMSSIFYGFYDQKYDPSWRMI